jgi:ribosome-binding protein aMBF1 (putative translation factor)
VILEPEVRAWLQSLAAKHFLKIEDRAVSHSRRKSVRERKLGTDAIEPEDVVQARREIRLSMALARAVYERCVELGLTQTQLADRAGLTQAKVSRIEGSDTVPTLPLLSKLAHALDASLNIALDDNETHVSFTPHKTDAA